jgi:Mrp family chromosome partitioning ATPase
MREVDEALARAFARRAQTDGPATVPPAPHWPGRSAPAPSERMGAADSLRAGTLATAADLTDFDRALPAAERPGAPGDPPAAALAWSPLVLALEREWGDRFEHLADALIDARDRRNLRVFLFTSCHRAEGRTTLVLALARCLSRRPGRTLLVDADLSGPMLARSFGLRPSIGFDDVVESGQALVDAVIDAPDDHLSLLPLRTAVARPREFLSSPAWTCSMARLRREFDIILLDGSPLFTGLSATVLHRSVDAAILVHNRSLTGERAILRAGEVLEAGGVPLLGLAETFV